MTILRGVVMAAVMVGLVAADEVVGDTVYGRALLAVLSGILIVGMIAFLLWRHRQ